MTPIEGGNHEQMGWYTGQPDDPPATISRQAQQDAIVAATLELLRPWTSHRSSSQACPRASVR